MLSGRNKIPPTPPERTLPKGAWERTEGRGATFGRKSAGGTSYPPGPRPRAEALGERQGGWRRCGGKSTLEPPLTPMTPHDGGREETVRRFGWGGSPVASSPLGKSTGLGLAQGVPSDVSPRRNSTPGLTACDGRRIGARHRSAGRSAGGVGGRSAGGVGCGHEKTAPPRAVDRRSHLPPSLPRRHATAAAAKVHAKRGSAEESPRGSPEALPGRGSRGEAGLEDRALLPD